MASRACARFAELFGGVRGAVIGMVHLRALPGSPSYEPPLERIVEHAVGAAALYRACGVDGVLVENTHDTPYLRRSVGSEVTACMTRVCAEVKKVIGDLPLGVQVLAGANREALSVAMATGAHFIRAEGFVFSHVADEGMMDACAGKLLRHRRTIGAERVLVLSDVKKKHSSHAITADLSSAEMSKGAEYCGSDGVILTGPSTGYPAERGEVARVREACQLPVLVGSGVSAENVGHYLDADAMIVGSDFKTGGTWWAELERERLVRFMERVYALRQ